jgi:hypothetical protein
MRGARQSITVCCEPAMPSWRCSTPAAQLGSHPFQRLQVNVGLPIALRGRFSL